MEIKWIQFAVIILFEVVFCAEIHQALWEKDTSEDNRVYNDAVIFTQELKSIVTCAYACLTSSADCHGFSLTSSTGMCRGYSSSSLMNPVIVNNTSFWRKSCHQSALGYFYDSIFNTCLKFYQTPLTRAMASNACADDGAFLIEPDTIQKLDALKAHYTDVLSNNDLWWVGGYGENSNDHVYDFRWSDGRAITNVWFQGEPNAANEYCIVYLGSTLTGLYNTVCSEQGYFVCEKTI